MEWVPMPHLPHPTNLHWPTEVHCGFLQASCMMQTENFQVYAPTWHTFQENGVRKKWLHCWVNNLNPYHSVSLLKPETDRNWAFFVFS